MLHPLGRSQMLPPEGIRIITISQTMEVIGLAHYVPLYLKLSAQEKLNVNLEI